jgi:hypothetical protein
MEQMNGRNLLIPACFLIIAALLLATGCASKPAIGTSFTGTRDPLDPPTKQELIDGQFLDPDIPRITVQKAYQLWDTNNPPVFIDVRLKQLYDLEHVPGARNIPLSPAVTIVTATNDPVFDVWKALPKDRLIILY